MGHISKLLCDPLTFIAYMISLITLMQFFKKIPLQLRRDFLFATHFFSHECSLFYFRKKQ
jgi:hypothetical protein